MKRWIIAILGIAIMVISSCGGEENQPPVISDIIVSDNPIEVGETTQLEAVADDPDEDILTYEWTATAGSFSATTNRSTSWTAPNSSGNYRINLKVEDESGASDESHTYIQVNEPAPTWQHDSITAVNYNTYPIYDFTYTYSSTSVGGLPSGAEIESVYVYVSIYHTCYSDLDVWLWSPTGNGVQLWNNDYDPYTNYDLTTNAFNTENPNGTWTLEIYDEYAGDEGYLEGWYATIYYRYQQ